MELEESVPIIKMKILYNLQDRGLDFLSALCGWERDNGFSNCYKCPVYKPCFEENEAAITELKGHYERLRMERERQRRMERERLRTPVWDQSRLV